MKNVIGLVLMITLLFIGCAKEINKEETGKIKVERPVFPNKKYSIPDFGGINDGLSLNTKAINKAIEKCNKEGGGIVVIPEGIWLTGPVELKNNVNIHLENGATLLFTTDFDQYPLIKSSFEGKDDYRAMSPIYGKDLTNIAITGNGIIDGNGQAWRPVKKMKLTSSEWNNLVKNGGVVNEKKDAWWPNKYALEASLVRSNKSSAKITDENRELYKAFYRPTLVNLINCDKVLLEGPTFQNSPSWNVHPLMCKNITINKVNIRNPWNAQNGDGLDLESCTYAKVTNSTFDVGDDAICIKSGKNKDGRKRNIPCSQVEIDNCVVYHGHGGFVVGSEMSGGVNNIYISNCTFVGTDVGLRFKSTRGRGGIVENIFVNNINMINIKGNAFTFNLFYAGKSPDEAEMFDGETKEEKKYPVNIETPQFKNIYFKNVICNGAQKAIQIQGLPEMPVKNLHFENIIIKADKGITCLYGDSLNLKNVKILSGDEPAMNIINSTNIHLDNFTSSESNMWLRVFGSKTENISLSKEQKASMKDKIYFGTNISEDIISVIE